MSFRKIILGSILYSAFLSVHADLHVSEVRLLPEKHSNGLANIFYTITGESTEPKWITVKITNKKDKKTFYATKFFRPLSSKIGKHCVTWCFVKDGVKELSKDLTCQISLKPFPDSLFLVIDLSEGKYAETYPISFLDSVPLGGWGKEYKTSKLVMRRIEPGQFIMGSFVKENRFDNDEEIHLVTISRPFYIGIFEVTQRQWELVMGDRPSYFSNNALYAMRPVENVSYGKIRGTVFGSKWPNSSTVDEQSFVGKIREKTGFNFIDLPTDAQWEYACQAGQTTMLNIGRDLTGEERCVNMDSVGRYLYNSGASRGVRGRCPNADKGTAAVGAYQPNAWGLYDMHGNVWEWCLDWYLSPSARRVKGKAVDPVGMMSGSKRLIRGGGWRSNAFSCRTSNREAMDPEIGNFYEVGFRLSTILR